MAKWNPASGVNASHLLTIIRRGDTKYLSFVSRLTSRFPCSTITVGVGKLLDEGVEAGFLPADAKVRIFPTTQNVTAACAASADQAKATMVASLLALGQDAAVMSLVEAGGVTEELVESVRLIILPPA